MYAHQSTTNLLPNVDFVSVAFRFICSSYCIPNIRYSDYR